MVKRQSPNPRGNPNMRRLQGVLNARYSDEAYPVIVLDWARSNTLQNGDPYPDRQIINQALLALGEKYGVAKPDDSAQLPTPEEKGININLLASELGTRLEGILKRVLGNVQLNGVDDWDEQKDAIAKEFGSAISTANLTGKSYTYNPEESDE